jgi:hypothetical protein
VCLCGFLCVCDCVCVCVQRTCVCDVPALCAHCPGTAGTCSIYSSARAARAFVGFARVGRRCHVEMPYKDRAVGCARWAHDRDRCRRHHLRHRRLRRLPPQGRVGEHRRRCATRLGRGVVGGYSRGVLQGGTEGQSRATHRVRTRPTHPRSHFRPLPVPLSLRRSTCTCSRRCHYMYGVHVSRQELCAC